VRFGDLDPAGVAYYPNLVHYLHVAFEDFFGGALQRPYPEVIAGGLGFPTVKLEMEFASPVRYGDPLQVSVAIEHVGRTSLQVRYGGRVLGREVFRASNVAVCVDMKTFQPVPIPDDLRAAFESARA
jgi:YbgC/YbaW family acyl-CoA thioester hydrolase